MLVRKILVVIIVLNVVLALFVFEGSAASAKGIASDVVLPNNNQIVDDNSGQCPATNAGSITPLNEGVTDLLLKVAQESEVFQLFVEELNSYNKSALRHVSQSPREGRDSNSESTLAEENELELATERSYAFQVGELKILYIPIRGGTGDSFYGIQFDESLSIVGTLKGIFTLDDEDNILFQFQVNNQIIADLVITENGEVLGGRLFDLEGNELDLKEQVSPNASTGWWGCMNSCLAWSGVPIYLIAGLSILCAAACVITAGLACGACIAAALGAWGGVGAFCLVQCEDGQW